MGRRRISGATSGADHQTISSRRGAFGTRNKRPPRRAAELAIVERDGHWHLAGTLRIKGRGFRIRASTGLPAKAETKEAAHELRRQKEQEIRDLSSGAPILPWRSRSPSKPI
jgi:hypothetical protein